MKEQKVSIRILATCVPSEEKYCNSRGNSSAKEGYSDFEKLTYRFAHPLAFRAMYCYTSSHMHPSK